MLARGSKGFELLMWAVWLGSLWFMAILVAPALFKWLPRPEAGLVAGRLFYMLSWYSLLLGSLMFVFSMGMGVFERSGKALHALALIVVGVCAVELLWLHPQMQDMRAMISSAPAEQVEQIRSGFGKMHAVSSVLYSIKMIAGLLWGLGRYTVKMPSAFR